MQGLRGHLHLRAQPTQERMQGLRGRLHLRAQPQEEQVRGLRGCLHLRIPSCEERVQGLQATQGELAAAGSQRERVLFIGTQFSILYTSMYSPAGAASPCA
jgi:hypothetical protein